MIVFGRMMESRGRPMAMITLVAFVLPRVVVRRRISFLVVRMRIPRRILRLARLIIGLVFGLIWMSTVDGVVVRPIKMVTKLRFPRGSRMFLRRMARRRRRKFMLRMVVMKMVMMTMVFARRLIPLLVNARLRWTVYIVVLRVGIGRRLFVTFV